MKEPNISNTMACPISKRLRRRCICSRIRRLRSRYDYHSQTQCWCHSRSLECFTFIRACFHYRSSTGKGTINYDTRASNLQMQSFSTIRRSDPEAMVGMDPTLSISAKGITIEGMALNAQDMGTIFIPASSYQVTGDVMTGTSTIEVGPDLMSGLFQITAKKDLVIRISVSADAAEERFTGSVHKDFVRGNPAT